MRDNNAAYGTLYVVATPIGNWGDISARALETLRNVKLIAAEDTRYTLRLMSHYEIKNKLISCRQANEERQAGRIIQHLELGEDVAYVSDAGTPGVSDPGAALVAAVTEAGFDVRPVPGAGAVEAALSVSGLCTGGYHFLGFMPRSRSKQVAELRILKASRMPIVFFESPRRIAELLVNAREALGDRRAALCRELTKIHEEIFRGTLSEISGAIPSEPLGEMVLVIAGATAEEVADGVPVADPEEVLKEAEKLIAEGMTRSDAAAELMRCFGLKKKEAYNFTKNLDAPEGEPEECPEPVYEPVQAREVVVTANGHPDIRAKHGKTLELKRGSDLSPKETCVAGVGAEWDAVALKKLTGRVMITMECEGARDEFEADICRNFNSADRIVIRKSAKVSPVTFAINATKGAADLDKELVLKLKNAGAPVRLIIKPVIQ